MPKKKKRLHIRKLKEVVDSSDEAAVFQDPRFNKNVLGWVSITTACSDFPACMTLNDPRH